MFKNSLFIRENVTATRQQQGMVKMIDLNSLQWIFTRQLWEGNVREKQNRKNSVFCTINGFSLNIWWIKVGDDGEDKNKYQQIAVFIAWLSQLRELSVELNRHRDWALAQFVDLLYCHLGTLQVLSGHRGSYPFDQIFYRLAFVVCFHLPLLAVDPIYIYFIFCYR